MKRKEILEQLGFCVPASRLKRVIIHSDINCEADDPFSIVHHLLTPSEEIRGIIAGHHEWMSMVLLPQLAKEQGMTPEMFYEQIKNMSEGERSAFPPPGTTMESSFQEGRTLLEMARIDDIPLLRGSRFPLADASSLPRSEGADFIIAEALKDEPRPLYVALQGGLTDLAIAYLKKPEIAEKIIAVWIGGGAYPEGGDEFNLKQDLKAAQILFDSPMEIWQIPVTAYRVVELSFAELAGSVKPCGKLGEYLYDKVMKYNEKACARQGTWPGGETWCIGDNPTVSVLLQQEDGQNYHLEYAPGINDDGTYHMRNEGKQIRVYDSVDVRLTVSDFFAKLKLCYKK